MRDDLRNLGLDAFTALEDLKLDCPGVYAALGEDGEVLYVGQSKLMKQRRAQHLNTKRWAKQAVKWVGYLLCGEDARLELEAHLILHHRPRWNQAIKLRIGADGHLTEVSFLPTQRKRRG